jgi:hypothetical protein
MSHSYSDRFISYDPMDDPPLPRPEPARPSLRRRLASFTVRWASLTGAYTLATLAVLILSRGRA